jgi:hypothetical protein
LIAGVGAAVELLELVVVAGTLVELVTEAEVVDVGRLDVDVTVILEQVAPPENVPQVPDSSLALLKSSV